MSVKMSCIVCCFSIATVAAAKLSKWTGIYRVFWWWVNCWTNIALAKLLMRPSDHVCARWMRQTWGYRLPHAVETSTPLRRPRDWPVCPGNRQSRVKSQESPVESRESGVESLESRVWSPQSGVESLESTVWSPQSGVRNLKSGVLGVPRDCRLSTLDCRLSTVDSRLWTLDCRLSTVDSRLSTLDC